MSVFGIEIPVDIDEGDRAFIGGVFGLESDDNAFLRGAGAAPRGLEVEEDGVARGEPFVHEAGSIGERLCGGGARQEGHERDGGGDLEQVAAGQASEALRADADPLIVAAIAFGMVEGALGELSVNHKDGPERYVAHLTEAAAGWLLSR